MSRSVWYKWTPSQTFRYRISTGADQGTGSTVDDTILGVYTSSGGDAGPFTEVPTTGTTDGCDDDSAVTEVLQSTLNSDLNAGTTYYGVVWKFGTAAPTAGNTAVQVSIGNLGPASSPSLPPSNNTTTPTQTGPAADKTAPKVTKFKLSNKKFAPAGAPKGKSKRGTTFGFTLSEAAKTKITVAALSSGRKVGKKCVKPTRKNRKKKRCKRAVSKGSLSVTGKAGKNSKKFNGKLRGRKLKPGSYKATLVATDAAGNKSKPVKLTFRVVRR